MFPNKCQTTQNTSRYGIWRYTISLYNIINIKKAVKIMTRLKLIKLYKPMTKILNVS